MGSKFWHVCCGTIPWLCSILIDEDLPQLGEEDILSASHTLLNLLAKLSVFTHLASCEDTNTFHCLTLVTGWTSHKSDVCYLDLH